MAAFLKLVSKQSRPRCLRSINGPSASTIRLHLSNLCRNTKFNHSSNTLSRCFPSQTVRHQSNAQTQTDSADTSNISPFITTCTDTTRPAAPRGPNRPNLALRYTMGQIVEGGWTVTNVTPIESYDCTAYEVEII